MLHTEFRHAARNEIAAWLEIGGRQSYFQIGPLTAYCRRSMRICGPCLDVAKLDVIRSRQKQGYGTAFLETAEEVANEHHLGLFVECVSNKHLQRLCLRMGLGRVAGTLDGSPSFVKPYSGKFSAKGNETKHAR